MGGARLASLADDRRTSTHSSPPITSTTRPKAAVSSQTAVFLPNQQTSRPTAPRSRRRPAASPIRPRTAPLAQPGCATRRRALFPTNVAPGANGNCPAGTLFRRHGVTYGPFRTGRGHHSRTESAEVSVPSTSDSDIFGLTLNWNVGNVLTQIDHVVSLDEVHTAIRSAARSGRPPRPAPANARPRIQRRIGLSAVRAASTPHDRRWQHRLLRRAQQSSWHRAGIPPQSRARRLAPAPGWRARTSRISQHDIDYIYRTDPQADGCRAATHVWRHVRARRRTERKHGALWRGERRGLSGEPARGHPRRRSQPSSPKRTTGSLPDRLRVTAGVRYSKVDLDYNQLNYRPVHGRTRHVQRHAHDRLRAPEKPLTPKLGLQYQFTDDKFVYASASKGFRAGGVSSQVSQTICQIALDNLGITAADIPPAFEPDTVKSYELGGKFRLFNRLQVNVAAFRIDWDDVQVTTTLTCGQSFTPTAARRAARAVSSQLNFVPLEPLQHVSERELRRCALRRSGDGSHRRESSWWRRCRASMRATSSTSRRSRCAGAQYNFARLEHAATLRAPRRDVSERVHRGCHVRLVGLRPANFFLRQQSGADADESARRHDVRTRARRELLRAEPAGLDKLPTPGFGDGRGCTPPAGQAQPPTAVTTARIRRSWSSLTNAAPLWCAAELPLLSGEARGEFCSPEPIG